MWIARPEESPQRAKIVRASFWAAKIQLKDRKRSHYHKYGRWSYKERCE